MPRLATLIAALVLALPGAALAQDAGDDQYQDPFGDEAAQQDTSGSGSGAGSSGSGGGGGTAQTSQDGGLTDEPPVTGGGSDSGSSGSGSAGQTGTQTTPAPTEPGTPPAAPEATPGQLPNTGSDPRALVLCGLAFVLIGVGLRLRTIDPDAY